MAANSTQRRLIAILAADVAGYSRLSGADEEGTLARIRALRSDLIDPTLLANGGRIANTAGDSFLVEFASVVDAVRAAMGFQRAMTTRNADFAPEKRIELRVGIHIGDVMVESDGDLMGAGVNIAARLEGIAKPGGVCLSEDAYRQVKGRLDLVVINLGEKRLKNIAEPVRVYSLEVGKSAKAAASKRRSMLAPFIAGIVALVVITSGAWYFVGAHHGASVASNEPAEAAHLSIVVLPFTNLSNDPSQDYFADGVTENLTTDLSRIRNSFVIARNTAFTFKGKNVDAKAIGKELGVRYVLEGSVQRDQNRVRVNCQLIDAGSGAHLWADRFEEEVADLFKLQDQIVARLTSSLGNELVKAEAEKAARSKNPDAFDLIMRGRALLSRAKPTKDNNLAARALFEQALDIDPHETDALEGEAMTYLDEYNFGWSNAETDYEAKILGQADRAIALASDNLGAYLVKSLYLLITRRWQEALRVADAGIAINPNFAPLYAARGWPENNFGRFEQAKSDIRQAMRLSPHDPGIGFWHMSLGDAEFGLGHFDVAIEEYDKANDTGCCDFAPYTGLAAAYALDGKTDEAKSALAEALRLQPQLSLKWLKASHAPNLPPLYEGLRKAGLPEE